MASASLYGPPSQVSQSTAITIHYEFTQGTSSNLVAANNEPIAVMICSEFGVDCVNNAEYTAFHTTGLDGSDYYYNFTPTFNISITNGYTFVIVINFQEGDDPYIEFGSSGSQTLPFISAGSGSTLTANIMHKDNSGSLVKSSFSMGVYPLNEWITMFISAHVVGSDLEYSAGIFYANGTKNSITGTILTSTLFSSTEAEKCYAVYVANNRLLLRSATYMNSYLSANDFVTKCSINGLCAAFDKSVCLDASIAPSSFWKYKISPSSQCKCSDFPSGCYFCPDGYYFDTDSCKQCHGLCATCNGPLSTNCLTCSTTVAYVVQAGATTCECNTTLTLSFDVATQTCKCPTHQYLNAGSCHECYSACENCNGPNSNECESCFDSDGVVSSGASTCTLLEGYFYDSTSVSIQKCFPSCITCDGKTVNDCLTCNETLGLVMDPSDVCICNEAQGFTLNATLGVCQCKEHFYSTEGKCLECNKLCGECVAPGTSEACISCTLGAILNENVCACKSIDVYSDTKKRCVLSGKFLGVFIAVGLLGAGIIAAVIVVLIKRYHKPALPQYTKSNRNKKGIE